MYELWNDKGSEILKSWIGLNVVFDNIFFTVLYLNISSQIFYQNIGDDD